MHAQHFGTSTVGRLVGGVLVAMAIALGSVVSLGPSVAAAVAPGTPWTWGSNQYGQLGDGSTASRSSVGRVQGLSGVVDLHGGREHVVALRSDGTVWVWGSNEDGQLGIGSSTNRSLPTQVPGLTGVRAVETGHNYTVVLLADGTVRTFGLNSDGQLGDGTTTTRRTPVTVVGLAGVTAIAAGRDMTYALRADGTLVSWGRNVEGQLGDGTTVSRPVPVAVAGITNVVAIAGGRDHAVAVRGDGTLWAWGHNAYGQVGDGTLVNRTAPVQIGSGFVDVAAGAHHSLGLRADGRVQSWGRNYRAELGDGTSTNRTRPVFVSGLARVVSIGAGRDTGMAVLDDGTVRMWGHNSGGQLGDGTTTNRTTPVVVPGVTGATKAGGGGAEYSVVLVGDAPPVNQAPIAHLDVECDALICRFDGSGSTDAEGAVVSYAWEFGDGASAVGSQVTHTYEGAGTYAARLVVTDDDGATASDSADVAVTPAEPPGAVAFRDASGANANSARLSVTVPGTVTTGDRLVLFVAINRAGSVATPPGWSLVASAADGTEVQSWIFQREASVGLAGTVVPVTLDAISKTSVSLVAYAGAGPIASATGLAEGSVVTTSHTAPAASATAGSVIVRNWVDKTNLAHDWTVTGGLDRRSFNTGSGSGLMSGIVADQGPVASTAPVPALAATSAVASAKAISWTLTVPPA